jgi:hypothetical protein
LYLGRLDEFAGAEPEEVADPGRALWTGTIAVGTVTRLMPASNGS